MVREKSLKELGNQQAILRFEIAIRLLDNKINREQAKSRINRIYQAYSNSLRQQFMRRGSI